MAKRQKSWVYRPPKQPQPKVPVAVKANVKAKADELIESILKVQHINPPPEDAQFNYIVDIFSKWYRHYFYFCSKYCSPGPHASTPFFEDKFARLEYAGDDLYNLSYMRHTRQWWLLYSDLSLDECLRAIRDEPFFQP